MTERIMPIVNDQGLLGMYLQLIEDSHAQLREALRLFTEPANYPIAVHCTGGKDRTGIVVALLLAMVGVPLERILEDFNVTEGAQKRRSSCFDRAWRALTFFSDVFFSYY